MTLFFRRTLLAASLALISAGRLAAPASKMDIAIPDISYKKFVLKNGLTLLVVAACFIAYKLIDPAPPRNVTLSTGQENSAYD